MTTTIGVRRTSGGSVTDAQRRRGLRRMKGIAVGALVLAAIVYAATVGRSGVWAYVNAGAEASMVGALADWFAVTALFRHPLGLPVPHTAIIPSRKDALGRNLQDFVAANFLTEPVVREQLAKAGIASRVGAWLSEPKHAERVAGELATAARGVLRVLRDEDVAALLEELVRRHASAREWSPPAGRLLERVVVDGGHRRLVDLAVEHLHSWLLNHRDVVIQLVMEQAPNWTPPWVDVRVAARVYASSLKVVEEIRDDPRHRVRVGLDQTLLELARSLQTSPATRDRFEAFVQGVIAREDVRGAASDIWSSVRQALVEAVEDPGSELRHRATSGLAGLGRRLAEDEELSGRIDAYLEDAVSHVVVTYRSELATVISDTVARWDGEQAARLIELHVGRDLQFIRLNGTIVGGLAGVVIYAITVAAH